MRCIVVDDDRTSILAVKRCIEQTPFLEFSGSFTDPNKALTFVSAEKIDLIFLDVEMPKLDGIDFIKQLPYNPEIIIVSSKRDYAFESFELNVTDYLQKPIDLNRFLIAAEKAFHKKGNLASKTEMPDHLFVKSDAMLVRLNLNEIMYIEAMGDYVRIFTPKQRHMVLSTMKSFEEKLPNNKFFRVHKSFIVNLDKVEAIAGNSIPFEKKMIPISKTLKPLLLEKLNLM